MLSLDKYSGKIEASTLRAALRQVSKFKSLNLQSFVVYEACIEKLFGFYKSGYVGFLHGFVCAKMKKYSVASNFWLHYCVLHYEVR